MLANKPRLHLLALASILLLAAGLRLNHLRDSLWSDEVLSVRIAERSWADMPGMIRDNEQTPPLYYALLKIWICLFGNSEPAVRSMSVVLGVAVVSGGYWLMLIATRSMMVGLVTALLLATSRFHIAYSQEARAYELLVLLAILSCGVFFRLLERRTTGREFAWITLTAAMLLTHLYGVFVVVAQFIVIGGAWQRTEPTSLTLRRWIQLNIAVAILYAWWVPSVVKAIRDVRAYFWVKPLSAWAIVDAYRLYSGSTAMLCAAVMLSIVAVSRMRERRIVLLLGGLALLPVVVPVVISLLTKPTFVPRYAIVASVGLLALAAIGVCSIPARVPRIGAIILLVALNLIDGAVVIARPGWREAGAYLTAHMRRGDAMAINRRQAVMIYRYYVHRDDVSVQAFDGPALPFSLPLEPRGKHVWLVLHNEIVPAEELIARGGWHVVSRRSFPEIQIFELDDSAPATTSTAATRPAPARPSE